MNCFSVPPALCCFEVPPALCCFTVAPTLCCFTADIGDELMNYNGTWSQNGGGCCPSACATKCLGTCPKKAAETKPLPIIWGDAVKTDCLAECESAWRLQSVTYDITDESGAAQTGLATDLVISGTPTIHKANMMSQAIVAGGISGQDYTITATATFRDCEQNDIVIIRCVTVDVDDNN